MPSPSDGPAVRSGERREHPQVLDGLTTKIRTFRSFRPMGTAVYVNGPSAA